jgi:hypothetical protein
MRRPHSLFLLLAVACSSIALPLHAAEPCKLSMIGDLKVAIGPAGGVLIPVSIDGQDAWMVLGLHNGLSDVVPQTVAAYHLAPHKLMENKGTGSHLREQSERIKSGKQAINNFVRIDSLRIGQLDLTGFEALIGQGPPGPMPRYLGKPVIGRLGSSLAKLFDVELNLAENNVRLFKAQGCKEAPVYWAKEFTAVPMHFDVSGTMIFDMDLEGRKIDTALATDTGNSVLDRRSTERFFAFKPDAPELERQTLPNGEVVTFRAMSLTAEGVKVNNTRVRLIDRKDSPCKLDRNKSSAIVYANCFNVTPFALGTDVLKRLRLIIVNGQDSIYVTAAAAPAPIS